MDAASLTDTDGVFLSTVCPVLGILSATLLFSAPMSAVLRARRSGRIGSLNPLPYPAITGTCRRPAASPRVPARAEGRPAVADADADDAVAARARGAGQPTACRGRCTAA